MSMSPVNEYLSFLSTVRRTPHQSVWLRFDADADVLYVNFAKGSVATDSELAEDDVIVRYNGEDIIGYTILDASKRH